MPESLRDLADMLGTEAALKMAARFGGRRLYIPATVREDSDIAECIGIRAMAVLVRYFGSSDVTFPRASAVERHARDWSIRQDREAGLSTRRLASKHSLSERRVWEILSAHRSD